MYGELSLVSWAILTPFSEVIWDIQSFNKSLKMEWVKGYLNNFNHGKKWKLFLDYSLQKYGGKVVFLSNLKPQDVPQLNLRDPFLREILEHWTTLNYKEKNLDFNSMGTCHNSLIRIENRPFFYTSEEQRHVQIITYFSARAVQLGKTITHFLTY